MGDREIIRALAHEYADIAALDIQKENARLYRALNGKHMIRPVVLMDEIPWSQLAGQEELKLQCTGEKEREVEGWFRGQLYRWKHFACDMIFTEFFPWHKHVDVGSMGVDVRENVLEYDKGNNIISHVYLDQLPDEESLEKLHVPEVTVDEEADRQDLEWLQELMGDILPIRLTGEQFATFFEPWDNIARWHGVENLLIDLMDRPEFMHAMVQKILDVRLKLLDKMEELNLLENSSPYLHCTAGLTDDLPGEVQNGRLTRHNIWGRGAAQIFASVSPAMTEEFEISYVSQYFKDCGLLYYGCCEPLDRKLDVVRKLPNLRKISITPWADVDRAADNMGNDYVMANKPNPAYLAVDQLDEAVVSAEIHKALAACKRNNISVEFTLKDISSVKNHPENLDRWSRVVMDIVKGGDW